MNSIERIAVPTVAGTPFGGGFFVDRYMHQGIEHALIAAPKAEGRFEAIWNESYDNVPGALSFVDGYANTLAMAAAGSKIAEQVLALRIGGVDRWSIPALDQLELCYRRLKPTAAKNALWNRSGINVSALPPTYPYALDPPAQTAIELFRAGNAEAFEPKWHWTSTQHANATDWAWMQDFDDGRQNHDDKANSHWVCAVRSVIIH